MGSNIIITKNLSIGALDAETDKELLNECFHDIGNLEILEDVLNPKSIILGRTGAGKSALIHKVLTNCENSVRLDPNEISIQFLEHSNIIKFFEALNINLDLFYRLLWKHLLIVEILRMRYKIRSEDDGKGILSRIASIFNKADKLKKLSLEYFSQWGDKFWLDTDEQLKEITTKLDRDTKAQIGSSFEGLTANIEGIKKLSEQEKIEIKQRAQQVVSGIQVKKLNEVMRILSDYSLDDDQKKYYIIIDQLDENWADTKTRLRFIKALIEEIKNFRCLNTVKIVVALRKDLLDLVYERTRSSGFQEEKFEAYILDLKWSNRELSALVDKRINTVFRSQYTTEHINFDMIFPKKAKGQSELTIEYLLDRTLNRPRDILQFINECFKLGAENGKLTWNIIKDAESNYSNMRLKSLKEEWLEVYPSFSDSVEVLRGLPMRVTRNDIKESSQFEETILQLATCDNCDPCTIAAKAAIGHEGGNYTETLTQILTCLYKVGAIGVKISSSEGFLWSYKNQAAISKGEVKRINQILIHKMLWRALDITDRAVSSEKRAASFFSTS